MKLNVTIELEDRHYQDPAAHLGIILQHLADAAYWNDDTGGELTDFAGRRIGQWNITDETIRRGTERNAARPLDTPRPTKLHTPTVICLPGDAGWAIQ